MTLLHKFCRKCRFGIADKNKQCFPCSLGKCIRHAKNVSFQWKKRKKKTFGRLRDLYTETVLDNTNIDLSDCKRSAGWRSVLLSGTYVVRRSIFDEYDFGKNKRHLTQLLKQYSYGVVLAKVDKIHTSYKKPQAIKSLSYR